MTIRVAIPDLISPSYFPAIAAVELGFLPDAKLDLLYPVTKTYEELREGRLDFVGGASHAVLYAFKDWHGARLLCALAQRMYWFLVVHKKFNPRPGDLSVVKGLRIGAAPGPVDGLKQMLKRAGITDAQIGPVPGVVGEKASFGLMAARALAEEKIDGFWANGMGAEVAVREGVGTVVLDARRDGSPEIKGYTFPALVATEKTIRERPQLAETAIKALARRLAQDGAAVVIADLRSYDTAAAELAQTTGARTLGLQVDVSVEKDVERMAAETMKAFGRIDILVNNAALFSTLELKPFEKIAAEEWRKVMDVNTLGVFLCCRACAPHMRKGGYGRI